MAHVEECFGCLPFSILLAESVRGNWVHLVDDGYTETDLLLSNQKRRLTSGTIQKHTHVVERAQESPPLV